ncbi:MAG: hypothetical protein H6719_31750 [Sandaracinaceae bacterium]|nr:hypothetical protein [Sandaracinaceae bacterium]
MRLAGLLLLAVLAGACGEDRRPAPAPTPAPAPEPDPDPDPPMETEPTPEPPPIAIGWDEIPLAPSAEARALNEAALTQHAGGHYEESAAGFARAVIAAPGWDIYRYNLATAFARQGHHDQAEAHLAELLERDLPSYGPRFEADPDLDAFRGTPNGARLRARAEALAELWERAMRSGLPTIAYRGPRTPERPPELLRAGVYLPDARRFVPQGPRASGARQVLLDPALGLVVVQSSLPDLDSGGERVRFRVFHARGGEPIVDFFEPLVFATAFHAIPDGIRFRVQPDGMAVIWNQRWREATALEPQPHESLDRMAPDRHFVANGLLRDPGFSYADWREQHLGNYTFRRASTPELLTPDSAQPIPVALEHGRATVLHSIVVSDDGATALLLSSDQASHIIERIDLRARTTAEWTRGHGLAYLRVHDGALYLQRRGILVRLAGFDAPLSSAERVLEGVRLD